MNRSETTCAKTFCEEEPVKSSLCDESRNRNPAANVLMVVDDEESIRLMLEIFACRGIHANLANDEKTVSDFFDKNDCSLAFIEIGQRSVERKFQITSENQGKLTGDAGSYDVGRA